MKCHAAPILTALGLSGIPPRRDSRAGIPAITGAPRSNTVPVRACVTISAPLWPHPSPLHVRGLRHTWLSRAPRGACACDWSLQLPTVVVVASASSERSSLAPFSIADLVPCLSAGRLRWLPLAIGAHRCGDSRRPARRESRGSDRSRFTGTAFQPISPIAGIRAFNSEIHLTPARDVCMGAWVVIRTIRMLTLTSFARSYFEN